MVGLMPLASERWEGEILALRWQDIDFRENLIHVSRRWYHNKFDLPRGNRTRYVEMSQQLMAVLQFAPSPSAQARSSRTGSSRH
jgi:hypothetical protein